MGRGRVAGEEAILRVALLWLLAISALAAPRTFAAAPVEVPGLVPALDALALGLLFACLLRRLISPTQAAVASAVVALLAALSVFRLVVQAVAAGTVSVETVGSTLLAAVVAIAGVAFIGLRPLGALAFSIGAVLAHVVVLVAAAGDQATRLLTDRGVAQSLRFGVTAIALFLVVALLSARRARERDAAVQDSARALSEAQELRHEERLRRQLYSDAAHELKNPMAVVRGVAETLATHDGDLTGEERVAMLRMLEDGVQRLNRRIGEVLRTGVDGDERVARLRSTAQDAIARAVASAGVATVSRVHLDVRAAADVEVDPEALDHVVENLLTNAVKYGEAKTPVHVVARREDGEVVVAVTSRGGDLTPDDEQRVFERHYRAQGHRELPGDGVGLSLSRRLVSEWGGRIWCMVNDETTTFAFTIPCAPPRLPGMGALSSPANAG